MKKMKQRITAGLLMAMMLVVGVCSNVTTADAATLSAKQYLAKMDKAYSKAKSMEMSMSVSLDMYMGGQKVIGKVTGSGNFHFDSAQAKYVQNTTVSVGGTKQTDTEYMYVKKSGKKLYGYTSSDGKNYDKSELPNMDAFSSSLGQKPSSTYSNVKIVSRSEKIGNTDTVKISCQITGKNMQEALKQMGINTSELKKSGLNLSKMKPIKVIYWIDKKTYRPVKCFMDMTDFMSDIFDVLSAAIAENEQAGFSSTDTELKCTKAKFVVTCKNFNKAKSFRYPKAVK